MAGNSTDDLFAFVKQTPAPAPKPPSKKGTTDPSPRSGGNNTLISDIKKQVDDIKAQDEELAKTQATSKSNQFTDTQSGAVMLAKRIDYVCEQQIYYTKKIENERRRLQETNRRILRAKTAILQRRKQVRLGRGVVSAEGERRAEAERKWRGEQARGDNTRWATPSGTRKIHLLIFSEALTPPSSFLLSILLITIISLLQISAAHDTSMKSHVAIRSLAKAENKLNLLLVKNNLTEKGNVAAKKEIENLRREKLQQGRATERLEKESRSKKAKIATLIKDTQDLQDKKDRVQRDMEVTKQKILDELEANTQQYDALKSELSLHQMGGGDRTTTLRTPLDKAKKATTISDEKVEADNQNLEGSLSQEEEQHIVSSINKAYWAIAKKKMDIQKQADKIHELVDDFKFLSQKTGVKDVETLIPILLNSEEENFRLFDVTNENNKELETLEVERGAIRSEIEKYMKIEAKQNEGKTR